MTTHFKFKITTGTQPEKFSTALSKAQKAGTNTGLRTLIEMALANQSSSDTPVTVTLNLTQVPQKKLPGVKALYHQGATAHILNSETILELEQLDRWQSIKQVKTLIIDVAGATLPAGKLPKKVRTFAQAASELNLAYTANYPDDGSKATMHGLVTVINNDVATQVIARSKKEVADVQLATALPKMFNRDEAGFNISIPFLRRELTDVPAMVMNIFADFWLAITKDRLIINIVNEDETITLAADTLRDILVEYREYFATEAAVLNGEQSRGILAAQYLQTFASTTSIEASVLNENIRIHLILTEQQQLAQVGLFNISGIKLVDLPVAMQGFNAVIEVRSGLADILRPAINKGKNKLKQKKLQQDTKLAEAATYLTTLETTLAKIVTTKQAQAEIGSPVSPAELIEKVYQEQPVAGLTQQNLGPHLAELDSLKASVTAEYGQKFKLNLIIGGRYSNKVKWDKVGINAWTQGEQPYLLQLPPLQLTTVMPIAIPIKFYTKEGLCFEAQVTTNPEMRIEFNEGNIYEYVRRAIGVPPETIITLPLLRGYGTQALRFERLTTTDYLMEF